MSNPANAKAAYIKPTLTEYGSLAKQTKMFGDPDLIGSDPQANVGISVLCDFLPPGIPCPL